MSIGRVPGITGIQPSIVDAKGDLIVATAADSVSRLAVGSNDQVLTADSAQATGVKWATPASQSWVKLAQTSFSAVASQAFDNVFTGTYRHYVITLDQIYGSTSTADFLYQARTATPTTISSNYYGGTLKLTYNSSTPTNIQHNAATAVTISEDVGNSADPSGGILFVTINASASTAVQGFYSNGNAAINSMPNVTSFGTNGSAGFLLSVSSGTMTGRATVYGVTE